MGWMNEAFPDPYLQKLYFNFMSETYRLTLGRCPILEIPRISRFTY